jgi:hypothetical protein
MLPLYHTLNKKASPKVGLGLNKAKFCNYIKNFFLFSLRLAKSSSSSTSLLLVDSPKAMPSTRQPVVDWMYLTKGI